MRFLRFIGRGLNTILSAALALSLIGVLVAVATNYNLTQGSGTAFGSLVIGGVNYAQHLLCDATTPSQCTTVNASGGASVAQQGTWTVQPGNTANTTAWLQDLHSMGGTAINSGCVGALSGFTAAVPATVCGIWGVYVINANGNGQNSAANSSPTVPPSDMAGNVPIANLVFGTTAAMTGTTSTQLLAATASKITYVSNISCVNSSSTGTFVTVQDGSGGTTLGTLTAAPSYGGDEQHNSVIPLYKTSSGNGLFVANVTTSANVICSASGWHN